MDTTSSNCTGPTGNPDIVGIGVLVSFGIEGVLIMVGTLGTVGIRMVYSWNSELPLLSGSHPIGKQYVAFKSLLQVFVDSAMYFSLSIQIAGLVYVLTRLEEYREAAMALYAGLFSLFPIYMALFVIWVDLDRPVYRLGMLVLVVLTCAALSIVVMIKFFRGDEALSSNECYRNETRSKLFLILSCSIFWVLTLCSYSLLHILLVPRGALRLLVHVVDPYPRWALGWPEPVAGQPLTQAFSFLSLTIFPRLNPIWGVTVLFGLIAHTIRGLNDPHYSVRRYLRRALGLPEPVAGQPLTQAFSFSSPLGPIWHLVVLFGLIANKIRGLNDPHSFVRLMGISIAFCGTWVVFTLLVLSRQYKTAQNTGNQENIMGYGQVLALLIWTPVAAEYFYVAYVGHERDITRRLPALPIAQSPPTAHLVCDRTRRVR